MNLQKTPRRISSIALRSFLITSVLPLGAVALLALALKLTLAEGIWLYDFFFKRQFVQWLLMAVFAIGIFHLVRRIPVVRRDWRDLTDLHEGGAPPPDGLVGHRWRQVQTAPDTDTPGALREFCKQLAEHDEAALEAAYRLSGDIVQILPLIGFFGTVLGLSFGLYENFLKEGGATTAAFAKAIAIAFDNTLLGLALTIILFAVQSMLRKREETALLRLNLFTSEHIAALEAQATTSPVKISVDENVTALIVQLYKLQMLLANPGSNLDELVKAYLSELQGLGAKMDGVAALFEKAAKIIGAAVIKSGENIASQMAGVKDTLAEVKDAVTGLTNETTDLTNEIRDLARRTEQGFNQPRKFTIIESSHDLRGRGTGDNR